MGLDMYLKASKYLGGWRHSEVSDIQFGNTLAAAGFSLDSATPESPSLTVNVTVMYWRKANAIHAWFVEHCQGGNDECQESYVSRESLEDLLKLCKDVLQKKDPTELPPCEGFFFGSTKIDECYWEDIQLTIDGLTKVLTNESLKKCDFYYRASW
jgi:hypothetical protein